MNKTQKIPVGITWLPRQQIIGKVSYHETHHRRVKNSLIRPSRRSGLEQIFSTMQTEFSRKAQR